MLRAAVLVPFALALGWLVLTTSGARAFPPHLGIAERLDPDRPERLYREAGREFVANRGRLSSETYDRLAAAARRDPLAADPFTFFGMRALTAGDMRRAEQLLIEARRRNPRGRITRLALLGLYLQTDRVADASAEIAVMVRLIPRSSDLLIPELARLAAAPQTGAAVVEAIGADPLMAHVLDRLVQNGADPDLVLRLAARQQPRPDQGEQWQARLLHSMVERGQIDRARAVWRRFARVENVSAPLIYDAEFRGQRGLVPFNWDLMASAVGSAERVSGPALEATFFGRQSGILARQLLTLSPGRYRLSMVAEGSANGQGSQLVWSLTCQPGGSALLELPVTDVSYAPKTLSGEFTVPAGGCPGQWLQLSGIAAEFPTTQSARISGLTLQRAGGGS